MGNETFLKSPLTMMNGNEIDMAPFILTMRFLVTGGDFAGLVFWLFFLFPYCGCREHFEYTK